MKGHWRRLGVQVAIGVSMLLVNAFSDQLYLVLVSLSLLIAPVIIWVVFAIMLWLSRQAPDIVSLSENVDDMMTLGIASTVGAIIAGITLARLVGVITQPVGSLITVGLGYIVVAIAIPAMTKLRTMRDVWLPDVLERRSPGDLDTTTSSPEDIVVQVD